MDAKKANQAYYDHIASKKEFIKGSPHLKHKSIQSMYLSFAETCIENVACMHRAGYAPRVLDLGAGDGTATISFLSKGCHVTAVDISQAQLDRFAEHYAQYKPQYELVCSDALAYIQSMHRAIYTGECQPFDIIVFNSFIHIIPDYLEIIGSAADILAQHGVLFIFQEPIFYPSLPQSHRNYAKATYLLWRITQGDMLGGFKRRLQRNQGDFSSPENYVEYHVVRDGVNQEAILDLLDEKKFLSECYMYFTTYFSFFQWLGVLLKIKSHFAIIAEKAS